jgi:two-component system, OmpR family, response regulator
MTQNKVLHIFLVDDDAVYLKLLEYEFNEFGTYTVSTFHSGEQCLKHLDTHPDIIILDYLLDGVDKTAMNGIETLDKIKAFNKDIPVVMLSCQDKIEVAVDCMHHHALDYVVKSETAFLRLQKIITVLSRYQKIEKELHWYMERM